MKKLALYLLPTFAFGQSLIVTPSGPSVNAGGTIAISTNRPAIFRLSGVGTISNGSGTTTTYTAPTSLMPQHVLNGCQVTPADSVFNTRIDDLPVVPQSAAWAAFATFNPINVIYQWGTNLADNSAPLTPETFYYTMLLNGTGFPIPALPDKKRESGAYPTDGNNDHHMLVVNHQSCRFYETYQEGDPNSVCSGCTAASGWTYAGNSYAQPSTAEGGGTTDAAGLPLAPLTLHLSELKEGVVRHALRFTACTGCIGPQFLWPAVYSTGPQSGAPPMGARFRLKSSFDISGYPAAAQVVLRALQQYGMFLADIGITGQITASSDVTEDPASVQALQTIVWSAISNTNFEVVDESSLMLNVNSSVVKPNNGHEVPENQAMLTVVDAANSANVEQVPIALTPVMVGTPDPTMVVQAGTPAFPIPSWVNGSASQGLTWTVTPTEGAGSVDAQGNYTAPAFLASPTNAVITATSVISSAASASIYVSLIPNGPIRIDSGSPAATVDAAGNTWLADGGFETGSFTQINDPSGAWGSIPNPVQTATYMYTWGDDIEYRMHVPNGNYGVTLTFGEGGCSGTYYRGVWDNGLILGPLNLQSQGQIALQNWNFGTPINYACRTPETVTIPASVTDTSLRFAVRATGGNDSHSAPLLNSVSISPSEALPSITISSAQQQTTVIPGKSLQLYATRWYLQETPLQWVVVSGPGTITQTGLYSAPARAATGQFVRIAAQTSGRPVRGYFTLFVPPSAE